MSQPINIQDELKQAHAQQMTRRALLGRTTQGLGLVALASLERIFLPPEFDVLRADDEEEASNPKAKLHCSSSNSNNHQQQQQQPPTTTNYQQSSSQLSSNQQWYQSTMITFIQ
jgi:hypothetical protein